MGPSNIGMQLSFVYSQVNVMLTIQKGRLSFKESPFYTILEPLTTVGECKGETHMLLPFKTQLLNVSSSPRAHEGSPRAKS
jgi:hypothetical protein